MSKLYLHSGYLNWDAVLRYGVPFNFVVGGRGTGKTYGILKYMRDHKKRFIYMRRTQKQLDIISKPEFSPFKAINADTASNISPFPITSYNSAFFESETDKDGKLKPKGEILGYTAALSTFSSLRSFDMSDVEFLIYDEFIPERHERLIKNEASAFFNAIETINRNRELKGDKPVTVICMANSNDAANPIFAELGLIDLALRQIDRDKEIFLDRQKGLLLITLTKSPISDKKQNTALYNLTRGKAFAKMALSNEFTENVPSKISSEKLIQYYPLVAVGEIVIYRHKSQSKFYASFHRSGTPETFGEDETDVKRFARKYRFLYVAYMQDSILFENYHAEICFNKYFS